MVTDLSPTERKVVTEYCRGLNDAEVAESLGQMVWTTRTHKKRIFQKWQINTTHEMCLLHIAKMKNPATDIRELRNKGVSIFFLLLVLFQMAFVEIDYARTLNNCRTARSARASRTRKAKDDTIEYFNYFT